VVIAIGFVGVYYFTKKTEKAVEVVEMSDEKEGSYLSKVGDEDSAYWKRGGWFFWNQVEEEEGKYNWDEFDERIRAQHDEGYLYIFPVVFPFAQWDQESCHPEDRYTSFFDPKKGGEIKVGTPCDMDAYLEFLASMVERYDGDGKDDMPDLKYPVKYWEIMNEGFPDSENKFFVGTSDEYLEILKESYETIKEEDPEAKVLHAGLAGFISEDEEQWRPFFEAGAGEYFDIANLHTIDTTDSREDLNVIRFSEFLEEFDLEDKPLWITETQFGGLGSSPEGIENFDRLLARATVLALVKGADKILYISNWEYWDDEDDTSLAQQVYENLVDQVNIFNSVEVIKEEYEMNDEDGEGVTSITGQYKFISDDRVVYVLWGEFELPTEIEGTLKVTDMYGESKTMESEDLTLSDDPVFVEVVD
jgi:hypothetical protein